MVTLRKIRKAIDVTYDFLELARELKPVAAVLMKAYRQRRGSNGTIEMLDQDGCVVAEQKDGKWRTIK